MILPDLPKQNKKDEADFGIDFRKWWMQNGMNAPYELKDTRGKDSISFSEITDDQIMFALAAKSSKGVLIRVEKGTLGAPDYVGFRNSPAWIVIKYPKSAEVIDIDALLLEKSRSKRKSLTSERARAISTVSITNRKPTATTL